MSAVSSCCAAKLTEIQQSKRRVVNWLESQVLEARSLGS